MYPPRYGPNDAPSGPYTAPRGFPAPGPSHIPVIDPALLPLPEDDNEDSEEDLPPVEAMFRKPRSKPVEKVAGSRRPVTAASAKSKGKQKVAPKRKAQDIPEEPESKRVKRGRGRVAGTSNYNDDDLDALLDLIEDVLPVGGLSWNSVTSSFNEWALLNSRPECSLKSLEAKFKQVCLCTLVLFASSHDTIACTHHKVNW